MKIFVADLFYNGKSIPLGIELTRREFEIGGTIAKEQPEQQRQQESQNLESSSSSFTSVPSSTEILIVCSNCKEAVSRKNTFCTNCGARLPPVETKLL